RSATGSSRHTGAGSTSTRLPAAGPILSSACLRISHGAGSVPTSHRAPAFETNTGLGVVLGLPSFESSLWLRLRPLGKQPVIRAFLLAVVFAPIAMAGSAGEDLTS